MRLGEGSLIHFTKSINDIGKILENGFLFVPNRRNLFEKFMGENWVPKGWTTAVTRPEPQYFGMVSFAQVADHEVGEFQSQFGKFGIAVKWEWAARNGIDRVIYIHDSGNVFSAFQSLFKNALKDYIDHVPYPDDGFYQMGLENKKIAGHIPSGRNYSNLLTIYEYMEPSENGHQMEWRLVNYMPDYSFTTDKTSNINTALNLAKSNLGNVRVDRQDIAFICCPWFKILQLWFSLPNAFRKVRIIPTTLW
ncbi:MAG: hypothetical protein A3I78_07645 [Gammaproteobacteria bacterium RIFCSPLOWO2_02_FULL_56_15]|nr:MAG: hypothetical protein A3I78_07645 [Gammaproteobacteria bacterium RIFCSPLOWO2_02_FULL_56_15]